MSLVPDAAFMQTCDYRKVGRGKETSESSIYERLSRTTPLSLILQLLSVNPEMSPISNVAYSAYEGQGMNQ